MATHIERRSHVMVVFIIIKKRNMQRDEKDGDRTQIIKFLGQEEGKINKKRFWIFHPPFSEPENTPDITAQTRPREALLCTRAAKLVCML